MALKPEPMQRALIVASKAYQPSVIEALHALRSAHFIDFAEQRDGEFSEFKIGKPLPQGEAASARLVRIRALLRHLGQEGAHTEKALGVRELEARLDGDLDAVEAEVSRATEAREGVRNSLHEGRELEAKLAPLASLPLRLEDFHGYDTLEVFVGRADPAFREQLPGAAPDHMLVTGDATLFALFVPKARAAEVTDLLYRHGFAEVEVPEGTGAPAETIRSIQNDRATLEARLQKADADIERLAGQHRDFLLAAEEHLSIQVEKAEAPLAFATSENAFVVDAWIPMSSVAAVESGVKKATRDNVYFARLETSDDVGHHGHAHAHAHDDAHGGAAASAKASRDVGHGGVDAAYAAHPHAEAPVMVPPTKYENGRYAKRYEWFTNLFSTPRYNEIDPTAIFAVVFPLFFGFMVGDLGLGLIMVLIGFLLASKLKRVDGMPQLGTAIMVAGVIAAVLGGFVFKDAFGIPLGVTEHMQETYLDPAGIAASAATCKDVYKLAHEPTWGCMLGMGPVHSEPLLAKVTDVPSMLLLSIIAGLVHLFVGLLFGIRNEWGHGGKHLAAKFGYLILLLAFFPAAAALLRGDMFAGYTGEDPHTALAPSFPITANQAFAITGIGVLIGAVILGWAEGVGGILEIPSMFGAIMSYLRLGAVAIAKGAMAIAFNSFTLVPALLAGGGVAFVLGLIGFLIAQLVLLALGLLSGGIQALRLNFVEFFTKFYKGGGTAYAPFGRERRFTAPTANAPSAAAVLINQP